ncbi:MAG: hypothetical protein ACKOAU_02805, partial [Pirellula sp.]
MDFQPQPKTRNLLASFLACLCAAMSVLGWIPANNASAQIGLPLSDPRFSISVQAHCASKSQQGNYIVYQLDGNVRITQGSFRTTCQKANLWVLSDEITDGDSTAILPTSALNASMNLKPMIHRIVLDAQGECDVQWSEEQRLRDRQWMGKLYSHHEPKFEVQVWRQAVEAIPPLDWSREESAGSKAGSPKDPNIKDAIVWTQQDEQNHLRLASQIIQSQPPTATPSVPAGQPLGAGNSMQVGNATLGGTVLDPGSIPLFETIQTPPQVPNTPPVAQPVESFQLPAPTANSGPVPIPLAAPVAASDPSVRSGVRVGARTFKISGRSGIDPLYSAKSRPERGDSVITISRGIRLMIGDVAVQTSGGLFDMGTVLIEADRCVVWTADLNRLLSQKIDDLPVELYLEGNIVFQQGARVIYADRMYYNVQSEYGMILGAEVLTPAPKYEGIVRLKADVIQQRSRENFLANRAAMTSSRLGVPRYWLQADRIELNDQRQSTEQTGLLGFGVLSPSGDTTAMKAKARHNFVYMEGLPVAYWPILNTNVDTPSFYITGARFRNDSIFGTQAMLDWNLYQILGIDAIDGTRWNLSTDYLSKRGFALGTNFRYNLPSLHGGGPAYGEFDAWGLNDKGLDTLGSDRINMVPEEQTRGRIVWQHRQLLSPDQELWGEFGYISDRNFLEQFF